MEETLLQLLTNFICRAESMS